MNNKQEFDGGDIHNWICPNLTTYWQLGKVRHSEEFLLQAVQGNQRFRFSLAEGFALQHFTGHFTVKQVQTLCLQQFGEVISPNFVVELLQKLIDLEILVFPEENTQESKVNSSAQHPPPFSQGETPKTPNPKSSGLRLKPCVHWSQQPLFIAKQ
jgi:putative peptide zinc metalloprotease protein